MQSSWREDDLNLGKEIQNLCAEKLSLRVPSLDIDLFESGLLDSLSLVQLIFELERHYQLELPLEELDISSLRSISAMASLISRRRVAASSVPPKIVNQLAG